MSAIESQNQNFPIRSPITQNDSGTINCPINIISSIYTARSIYMSYRESHIKRITLYAAIEGLIAGNPPYDPKELATHGLSHVANFNNLDARSFFKRAALAYYNLLYSAERIADFTIISPEPEARRYADIMSDNFDKVVKSWHNFSTVFNTLVGQIVKFGISPAFWSDERDWRWDVIELQRFFVAAQAPTNTDKLTCVCVESIFTAQYLYDVYEQFKDKKYYPPSGAPMKEGAYEKDTPDYAQRSPWNIEALEHMLLYYANQSIKSGNMIKDMMDLQQRIQANDFLWESVFGDGFRLVSMYQREYDGKISHYMFDRNSDMYAGQFLYFVDRQYKDFNEGLIIFTADPGEFSIHSNRGVGHVIFPICQAMMQTDCAIVDMSKMASTILLKTNNVGGREFAPIKIFPGVMADIGSADVAETNFGANIQQLIGSQQYFIQKVNYNAANSGDDPGIPDRDQGSISPTQAKMQSFREFGVPKNNIQHFYTRFDLVIANMVIKMLHSKPGYPGYEYADKWKKSCIAQGVPAELFETKGADTNELPSILEAKATRVAGDGSTLSILMGLEALMPMLPEMTPKAVKEFQRQLIRAVMGPEWVSVFIDETPQVGDDISVVALENGVMKLGQAPIMSPGNDQQTHIVGHLALGNDIASQVQQQQMTPVDADKILNQLIPHMKDHIQVVSQSITGRPFFEKVKGPWNELLHFAENNRVAAAKMTEAEIRQRQQDAQKQDQVMSEAQRKDWQVQQDAKRDDYKVSKQVERADTANVNRAEIMKDKNIRDADNNRLKVVLNANNKQSSQTPPEETAYPTQKAQLQDTSTPELRSQLKTYQGQRPAQFDIE